MNKEDLKNKIEQKKAQLHEDVAKLSQIDMHRLHRIFFGIVIMVVGLLTAVVITYQGCAVSMGNEVARYVPLNFDLFRENPQKPVLIPGDYRIVSLFYPEGDYNHPFYTVAPKAGGVLIAVQAPEDTPLIRDRFNEYTLTIRPDGHWEFNHKKVVEFCKAEVNKKGQMGV